jgi:hypothetical protein
MELTAGPHPPTEECLSPSLGGGSVECLVFHLILVLLVIFAFALKNESMLYAEAWYLLIARLR